MKVVYGVGSDRFFVLSCTARTAGRFLGGPSLCTGPCLVAIPYTVPRFYHEGSKENLKRHLREKGIGPENMTLDTFYDAIKALEAVSWERTLSTQDCFVLAWTEQKASFRFLVADIGTERERVIFPASDAHPNNLAAFRLFLDDMENYFGDALTVQQI